LSAVVLPAVLPEACDPAVVSAIAAQAFYRDRVDGSPPRGAGAARRDENPPVTVEYRRHSACDNSARAHDVEKARMLGMRIGSHLSGKLNTASRAILLRITL
jgi:hypothetical protein